MKEIFKRIQISCLFFIFLLGILGIIFLFPIFYWIFGLTIDGLFEWTEKKIAKIERR